MITLHRSSPGISLRLLPQLLVGALAVAMTYGPANADGQIQVPKDETVVLLHGLARTSRSMQKLEKALIQQGYSTCNIDYPSRDHRIEVLARHYVLPEIQQCLGHSNSKLSFITHSMGGIIVRRLLKERKFENLNAVVMLAPPNQGSEVADKLSDFWLFDFINGPAGGELGTDPKATPSQLGPAAFTLGIIAGDASINPINSLIIPGNDDGKVSVARAKLEGMTDFLVVSVSHPFIMRHPEVIRQSLHFLEHHRFRQ